MMEVKWEELPQAEYLKGPIRTHQVYAEEDVDSLSEAGKTAIRHFRARFPRLYAPRSAAVAAAAPMSSTPMTECLSEEAAAAAAAAVGDTAVARLGWTHLGFQTPVAGESNPVLRVRGRS